MGSLYESCRLQTTVLLKVGYHVHFLDYRNLRNFFNCYFFPTRSDAFNTLLILNMLKYIVIDTVIHIKPSDLMQLKILHLQIFQRIKILQSLYICF